LENKISKKTLGKARYIDEEYRPKTLFLKPLFFEIPTLENTKMKSNFYPKTFIFNCCKNSREMKYNALKNLVEISQAKVLFIAI